MKWKWVEKDGQPPATGEYVVALAHVARVRVLYWDGEVWKESMYMAAFRGEVMAWTVLPDYPTRREPK